MTRRRPAPILLAATVWAATVLAAGGRAAVPVDDTRPATVEPRTVKVKAFDFAGGRTAAVRLAYRTLGTPHRGADGQVDNAVLLLHGTGETGASFLGASAARLFGPGAPLDTARTFVILPDLIGGGGSSRPSEALGVNFPHYTYDDMIRGARAVVQGELGIARLRLILGVASGAMLGWSWAGTYPGDAGAVVAVGAWPTAVGGGNLLWRLAARDALLANSLAGGAGARVAATITLLAGVPPALLARRVPDAAAARLAVDAAVAGAAEPVDLAFQFDAVRGYDAAARLGAVTATVVAVNFADDPLYPRADDPIPRLAARYPRIGEVVVPASTGGPATSAEPAAWLPYAEPAIRAALAK